MKLKQYYIGGILIAIERKVKTPLENGDFSVNLAFKYLQDRNKMNTWRNVSLKIKNSPKLGALLWVVPW
jgi:hypothetical protein